MPRDISFLFKEVITCGAVLSTFELVQALRSLGHNAYIISKHRNPELENYFNITVFPEPVGTKITCTPRLVGDYAYVRTKDGRWLNHKEPKIAVSQWIADWVGTETVIGNGTHKRFTNYNLKRDIDILIEGNDEKNKNIEETIEEARKRTKGKIVWFGRQTKKMPEVENISSPGLDEIVTLYNRSKVFLKMSKEEGWGRPVAEARACGCKVINLSGGNKDIELVSWDSIAKKLIKYLDETARK